MNQNISSLTLTAIQAALKAGDILKRGFGTIYEITIKSGRQNFVTEHDKRSEECIISFIKERYPTHAFLAEESGLSDSGHHTQEVMWIIDPLDGTSNFARHLPIFTISIAATSKESILCGVIYHPLTHELFVAERGKGAYLNGTKIHVSKISSIEDCMLIAGLPFDNKPMSYLDMEQLYRISHSGVTTRNLGSAALSLAYIAAGKIDALWMYNLYPWDLAAGQLLIEEAGGTLTQYFAGETMLYAPANVLATNFLLHERFKQFIR